MSSASIFEFTETYKLKQALEDLGKRFNIVFQYSSDSLHAVETGFTYI